MSILNQSNFQRGFGTWPLKGKVAAEAISNALEVGYRAIDTAQMYGNEAEVGKAIADSGIARDELCITTKVTPGNFAAGDFMPSVEESLAKLKLDYVDLLLLHWPPEDGDVAPSVKLLGEARKLGLAKHIGVSNYNSHMLRVAKAATDEPIINNQVEFHPLLNQSVLLGAATELGIGLSAYCSVARGEVFNYPQFAEIGKSYDKAASQVVLRWIVQQGVAAITMSTKKPNMAANYDIMDFELSDEDMGKISKLTATNHRLVTKALVPWAPDWD